MDRVELVARVLCERAGRDPDGLEPGDVVITTNMDEGRFQNAFYDDLFDNGRIPPDGHNGKDPCHFKWREYIFTAQAVLRALDHGLAPKTKKEKP
jgi:hypothetical protein